MIETPEPFEAPLTPVDNAVHEKVVPGVKLLNAIEVESPEHSVCDEELAIAKGTGLTRTAIDAVPVHPKLLVTVMVSVLEAVTFIVCVAAPLLQE